MNIKIFGGDSVSSLETEVQEWLDDNPSIIIDARTMSAAGVSTYCYIAIWYHV